MIHTASDISDTSTAALYNPGGSSPILLICEHASNFIPASFNGLGLDSEALSSHIAWDPGALAVAKELSRSLDAMLVHSNASRLLFDCNRPPGAVDAIAVRSEKYTIPGNCELDDHAIAERIQQFYKPFCTLVEQTIERGDHIRGIVTIHSFTPEYHGQARAVELGVISDADSRLADQMLAYAPTCTSMLVAHNLPYGPEHGVTHTLKLHGIENGLLNVMLEIRNDLIAEEKQQKDFALMLQKLIGEAFRAITTA